MKIAVTGTPGTGKTTVSELLENEGYDVVHLTQYVKEKELGQEGKKEFEVDVPQMVESLRNSEFDVVEGHLAHHIPVEVCVVLRTRPDVLRERLKERNYTNEKIEENVQSEILDVLLSEAVEKQETVIEINTTEREPETVLEIIKEKMREGESDYGNFDWTDYL